MGISKFLFTAIVMCVCHVILPVVATYTVWSNEYYLNCASISAGFPKLKRKNERQKFLYGFRLESLGTFILLNSLCEPETFAYVECLTVLKMVAYFTKCRRPPRSSIYTAGISSLVFLKSLVGSV